MTTGNVRPEGMERITTPVLAQKFIEEQVKELREQIGDKKVLLALSGGVDSSVVAALLIKAVGKQLVSVHVNHGLLRKGEPEQVVRVFRDELDANLVYVDATERFLNKLTGVADPEQKRKIIGAEFIRVFEEEARKQEGISFLRNLSGCLKKRRVSRRVSVSLRKAQFTLTSLNRVPSSHITMWVVFLMISSLNWWNLSSCSSRMKCAWWVRN